MTTASPKARAPFHVLTKPIGPICNLDCEYCFYLKKEELYPNTRSFRMTDEVLETFVRQYIESHPPGTEEINFAWQGGEPTLMGVDFFRKAVALQQQYARPGVRISNSLQTNGTRLNDEWGVFLRENQFLVGLSIDGPRELHDKYRFDKRGQGTFDQVMAGLDLLKKHSVDFNTLTVVNEANGEYPVEVYSFLKSTGSTFFQFIPIVEPENGSIGARSVGSEQYGRFLVGIFDSWLAQKDVGRIFVRDFDTFLALVMGYPSPLCVHAETCGRAVALEHNGDLYSCDHFVNPEDHLGNILTTTLGAMLDDAQQSTFGTDKRDKLPRYCRSCEFLGVCNGGCPKDRLIATPDGEPGLNYLCAGYKTFFSHAIPVLQKMATCLRMGRPASDYARADELVARVLEARAQRPTAPRRKVGPNDPCPCGSGKKYKKCCMA